MERSITFFKEHLIRKAMGLPATTSNKNHKAAQKCEGQGGGDREKSLSPRLTD